MFCLLVLLLIPLPTLSAFQQQHPHGGFVFMVLFHSQVQERFTAEGNDRLKLVVLLCGEDDDKVQNAAAGALAMLTAAHKSLCHKLPQVVTLIAP